MVITSYCNASFQLFGLQENLWDLKKQNYLIGPNIWLSLVFYLSKTRGHRLHD